ncbi:MAG: DNA-binding protein [Verrucomicrobiaceae bacterium]|nr:MAG: DNA-binding protein [Verrucomicrobiaceae bacterium]
MRKTNCPAEPPRSHIPSQPRLLTMRALCERLSIGRTLASELVAQKKIRSISIGRRRLVDAQSVEEFIAERLAQKG